MSYADMQLMFLYLSHHSRHIFNLLNSLKMQFGGRSSTSTAASLCSSSIYHYGNMITDEDRRINRYNRAKSTAIDIFFILDHISGEVFRIDKIQHIVSSIYTESKKANDAESMHQSIQRAYTMICKQQWTLCETRQLQQFQKIQKKKYDALMPNRCVYQLGEEWQIWRRLIDSIEQYRIQREKDQTRVQNAMLVLFNLRSFLFGTIEQQQLISKLIEELYIITRVLDPQRLQLFWEFLCKQAKIFMQALKRYKTQLGLAFIY